MIFGQSAWGSDSREADSGGIGRESVSRRSGAGPILEQPFHLLYVVGDGVGDMQPFALVELQKVRPAGVDLSRPRLEIPFLNEDSS